jgi:hypothetical protein
MTAKTEIVRFTRTFQIWTYTVSHAHLLLRSPKEPGQSTRIDVLFKNVAWINLPATIEGLVVTEMAPEETEPLVIVPAEMLRSRKIFAVETSRSEGFVVAGAFAWQEDDGDYSEPSPLLPV